MTGERGAPRPNAKARQEAATWLGRMRGADPERIRPSFEAWRSADPSHPIAYAEVEALWQRSYGLSETELGRARQLPRGRAARLQAALRKPYARPVFASLLAAIVAGLAFALLGASGSGPSNMIAASASPLVSKIGEIRTVKLEDGSSVTLDTDSAIHVVLTGSARLVRLIRGRARFSVAVDGARPFRVEAGGRTATALGTIFDVGYAREGVRVALLRGAVRVAPVTSPGQPPKVTLLSPGECLEAIGSADQVTRVSPGADRWVSGLLSFDGTPLADVIEQTNRYSSRKIRLSTPAVGAKRVTGAFRPLPVDALARSLATGFSLRGERTTQGDILLR